MHWIDPDQRGLFSHPHAAPPPPSHRDSNDIGARLARMEEHVNFQAWNARRVEQESRMRADDILYGLTKLSQRSQALEQLIQVMAERLRAIEAGSRTFKTVEVLAPFILIAMAIIYRVPLDGLGAVLGAIK